MFTFKVSKYQNIHYTSRYAEEPKACIVCKGQYDSENGIRVATELEASKLARKMIDDGYQGQVWIGYEY